jgi:general secretion pathway protein I
VDRLVRRHLGGDGAPGRVSRHCNLRVDRARARGFTLIELLIALAIFAIVATTVYTRSGDVIRQTSGLEERTLATWLADNELALLRMSRLATNAPLVTGTQTRQVVMSGRNWTVTDKVIDTNNPWLRRVDVAISPQDTRAQPATYTLTGYIGRY